MTYLLFKSLIIIFKVPRLSPLHPFHCHDQASQPDHMLARFELEMHQSRQARGYRVGGLLVRRRTVLLPDDLGFKSEISKAG